MTSEKILQKMFSVLHDIGSTITTVELCLQILAWVKLSEFQNLSPELQSSRQSNAHSSAELIRSMTQALAHASKCHEDSSHTQLFFGTDSRYESIPLASLTRLLNIAHEASLNGLLDSFVIPASAYQSLSTADSTILLPSEVISLMAYLATDSTDSAQRQTVYCPYDDFALFSRTIAQSGNLAYLESFVPSSIPWLTSVLSELDFSIGFGKFLAQPTFNRNAYQSKFHTAVALVPIDKTNEPIIKGQDRLDAPAVSTTSMSILALLDIMEQTAKSAIIAVPNNILFGRGAARSLRQHSVDKGIVKSVISMHPALLFKTTLQFSILILDFETPHEHIQFIDGGADVFVETDGLNRAYLKHWEKLVETIQQSPPALAVQQVPVQTILANDYQLEASRYVLSPKRSAAYTLIHDPKAKHTKKSLYQCAEFLRSSPRLYKKGKHKAFEVTTSNFPDFGYVRAPTKEIYINDQALKSKEKPLFIHPHDILVSVKGTTGKVAIAPTDIPPPGKDGWLVNQSCLILRVYKPDKDKPHIEPIILFMYLRSDIGQILLEQIVSGAKTSLIQLQPLKNLTVLIPDQEDSQKTINIFNQQVSLQRQINQLKEQQYQLSRNCWGLQSQNIHRHLGR